MEHELRELLERGFYGATATGGMGFGMGTDNGNANGLGGNHAGGGSFGGNRDSYWKEKILVFCDSR